MTDTAPPLAGKIALVTGASRGIGRAIAMRLARDGALVAVHYAANEAAARATVAAIEQDGGQAFALSADLRTLDGVDRLVDALDAALTRRTGTAAFDILVNNAAIGLLVPLAETSEELFDEICALNVKAPFFLLQRALPRLRDGGRVINLSSCITRMALPTAAAYAVSKGAIDVLSLQAAKALAPRGITVNALAPGVTETDMTAGMLGNADGRAYAAGLSMFNRVGRPEDVADIAAFLAGPGSRWLTGHYVDATGGTLAQ